MNQRPSQCIMFMSAQKSFSRYYYPERLKKCSNTIKTLTLQETNNMGQAYITEAADIVSIRQEYA